MLESVLVANRGEIARRVIATARRLGVRSVAVYSEADADLPFVREADEAVLIGPAQPAAQLPERPARAGGRTARPAPRAIHPGYGFLAENAGVRRQRHRRPASPGSARRPSAIEQMGDKINARNLMEQAGVPVSRRHPAAGRRRGGRAGRGWRRSATRS